MYYLCDLKQVTIFKHCLMCKTKPMLLSSNILVSMKQSILWYVNTCIYLQSNIWLLMCSLNYFISAPSGQWGDWYWFHWLCRAFSISVCARALNIYHLLIALVSSKWKICFQVSLAHRKDPMRSQRESILKLKVALKLQYHYNVLFGLCKKSDSYLHWVAV